MHIILENAKKHAIAIMKMHYAFAVVPLSLVPMIGTVTIWCHMYFVHWKSRKSTTLLHETPLMALKIEHNRAQKKNAKSTFFTFSSWVL